MKAGKAEPMKKMKECVSNLWDNHLKAIKIIYQIYPIESKVEEYKKERRWYRKLILNAFFTRWERIYLWFKGERF